MKWFYFSIIATLSFPAVPCPEFSKHIYHCGPNSHTFKTEENAGVYTYRLSQIPFEMIADGSKYFYKVIGTYDILGNYTLNCLDDKTVVLNKEHRRYVGGNLFDQIYEITSYTMDSAAQITRKGKWRRIDAKGGTTEGQFNEACSSI